MVLKDGIVYEQMGPIIIFIVLYYIFSLIKCIDYVLFYEWKMKTTHCKQLQIDEGNR